LTWLQTSENKASGRHAGGLFGGSTNQVGGDDTMWGKLESRQDVVFFRTAARNTAAVTVRRAVHAKATEASPNTSSPECSQGVQGRSAEDGVKWDARVSQEDIRGLNGRSRTGGGAMGTRTFHHS